MFAYSILLYILKYEQLTLNNIFVVTFAMLRRLIDCRIIIIYYCVCVYCYLGER